MDPESEARLVLDRLGMLVARADAGLMQLQARQRSRARMMDAARRRAKQTALLLG